MVFLKSKVVLLLFPTTPIKKGRGIVSTVCQLLVSHSEWMVNKKQTGNTTGLLAEELLTQPGFTFLLEVTKTNPYKMYETKLLRN